MKDRQTNISFISPKSYLSIVRLVYDLVKISLIFTMTDGKGGQLPGWERLLKKNFLWRFKSNF
jgi:hypothetical protein